MCCDFDERHAANLITSRPSKGILVDRFENHERRIRHVGGEAFYGVPLSSSNTSVHTGHVGLWHNVVRAYEDRKLAEPEIEVF